MKHCKICQQPFTPRRIDSVCCGPKCRRENARLRSAQQYVNGLDATKMTDLTASFDRAVGRFWRGDRLDNGGKRARPSEPVSKKYIDVDFFDYARGLDL